jgi:hypothetical protein
MANSLVFKFEIKNDRNLANFDRLIHRLIPFVILFVIRSIICRGSSRPYVDWCSRGLMRGIYSLNARNLQFKCEEFTVFFI